jgi:RecB family exonuclease
VITPRTTRLVRVADLHGFREAAAALACEGAPLDARDRLVVVPTRAAAAYLVRSIEDALLRTGAPAHERTCIALPVFATRDELHARLAERLPQPAPPLTDAEREVILGAACRAAVEDGADPPFRLRPGLVAEILRFYDTLRRHRKDVAAFERLALGILEPGAAHDRGAERLVRQTRFLASAFRRFEERCGETGSPDEHTLAQRLVSETSARPFTHVVVTVGDRASDPQGLFSADWDVLARLPGLARLDVVATDVVIAGAFHERIHQLLPGLDEARFDTGAAPPPVLVVPAGESVVHVSRDREEEVAGFARRVRQMRRSREQTALDRVALVVQRPLPYVYLAREVLRSAGIPCQTFDALPLAAEPYAAALDLVFSLVSSGFARGPATALLASPHFTFGDEHGPLTAQEVRALDAALIEQRYLGDVDMLDRLEVRGARVLRAIVHDLLPLRSPAPCGAHLQVVLDFLARHGQAPQAADEALLARQRRARAAVVGVLATLRDAFARYDTQAAEFDTVAATVRRWIESHTFAPRTGDGGVHLVDAASAPFGDFDVVQLAGLVDGEWPERPRRNVFYSPSILRELGWPAEAERLDRARSAFRDLLRLPAASLVVSSFTLENDAVVAASSLVDEVDAAGLQAVERETSAMLVFQYERLAFGAVDPAPAPRFNGGASVQPPRALSLSGLERYQDCPFKFFAADVLRLEDLPEDEGALSPRARGRFIHEVFERFFKAWDARGGGAITPECLDDARAVFEEVAADLLAQLPEADAGLERARLFGSAISTGMVDVVLGLEAARESGLTERWLEYRLEGEFSLGADDGRAVALRGVADRIDLLTGNRLRVVDYKSGYPPNPKRALQVPIYALCAKERLEARDGRPWQVEEAAYVAFSGKRSFVPVIRAGAADAQATLTAARDRVYAAADAIGRAEFPVRPHDPMMCRYCAYPSVCRKDYVGDE